MSSGLSHFTQYIQDENWKFLWEQCELTVHIDQFHQKSWHTWKQLDIRDMIDVYLMLLQ